MRIRRPLAAVSLAAAVLASCTDGSGPPPLGIKDAAGLAAQLEAIDASIATAPLRALSGLTIPINRAGIDVNNMSSQMLGKTIEWSAIHGEVIVTSRAGAPSDAVRVILYTTDSTSRPAYPLTEIGYADLYPHNSYNGGGRDSMSLRYVVTDARATPGRVVADFIAHSSNADSTCQCATVNGWVSDGATRVDFLVPYHIPLRSDGQFPGSFATATFMFDHFATLPGPGVSTSTASLALTYGGDSITMKSGLLRPHAGRLNGDAELRINGTLAATVTRSATGVTATQPGGQPLTSGDLRAVSALFAVPADIAYYVEWPTFVIFFCGC